MAIILWEGAKMKISLVSISVKDQKNALDFYTQKLGFIKKTDIPMGDVSWLTVVSPQDPEGPELVLEPNAGYPAMKALKEALVEDGIPFTAFEVDDIDAEHSRLIDLGVRFTKQPMVAGGVKFAVFDDTCGNLIQIYQQLG
jgi:catechol 2,3-dioxygenase-like lactoylglutathione lyase family enzyme